MNCASSDKSTFKIMISSNHPENLVTKMSAGDGSNVLITVFDHWTHKDSHKWYTFTRATRSALT